MEGVLLFTPEMQFSAGGVFGSQVLGQAKALGRQGFRCGIVAGDENGSAAGLQATLPNGRFELVHAVSVVARRPSAPAQLLAAFRAAAGVLPVVRKWRPAQLYVRSFLSYSAARILARSVGAQVVYDARGLAAEESKMKAGRDSERILLLRVWEQSVWRSADRLTCVSVAFRNLIQARTGRRDVVVIPCCIDPAEFNLSDAVRMRLRSELGWEERSKVAVYSGSASVWQRIDDVVELMAMLVKRDREIRCLIVSSQKEVIEQKLRGRDVQPGSIVCTKSGEHSVAEWLSAGDIGIILRDRNLVNEVASPIKIVEYLASGSAVVCSPGIGDLSDAIFDHGCGVVVSGEAADMADVAAELLNRSVKESGLRSACRDLAACRFSWDSQAEAFSTLFGSSSGSVVLRGATG